MTLIKERDRDGRRTAPLCDAMGYAERKKRRRSEWADSVAILDSSARGRKMPWREIWEGGSAKG